MKLKWQKLASLAQEICTLWFQFFGAVFASKEYPFKNIYVLLLGVTVLVWKLKKIMQSTVKLTIEVLY